MSLRLLCLWHSVVFARDFLLRVSISSGPCKHLSMRGACWETVCLGKSRWFQQRPKVKSSCSRLVSALVLGSCSLCGGCRVANCFRPSLQGGRVRNHDPYQARNLSKLPLPIGILSASAGVTDHVTVCAIWANFEACMVPAFAELP